MVEVTTTQVLLFAFANGIVTEAARWFFTDYLKHHAKKGVEFVKGQGQLIAKTIK